MRLQEQQRKHSKMDNLHYEELKLQPYFSLHGVKVENVRNIFRLRTRMAPLGENFRGNRDSVSCPLCSSHLDNQDQLFQCPALRKEINITCDMDDKLTESINLETAEMMTQVLKLRHNLLEEKEPD